MKVLVIEDEYPAAERLQKLINKTDPGMEVMAVLDSVEGAVEWLSEKESPELIFSDIQLSDGLSFEIYDKVGSPCPIIFTTAYDEYAIRAFQHESIDYLLKPVKQADLKRALEKLSRLRPAVQAENPFQAQLEGLLKRLEPEINKPQPFKRRFLVKGKDQFMPIPEQKIAFFYTANENVYLIPENGRRYPVDFKMDDLIKVLDPARFFRLNRQYIGNLDAIEKVHPYFNGRLKVQLEPDPGEEVIVSRDRAKSFRKWLGE